MVAPSNGFNRIGESDYRSFGHGLGASVVLPKHLLAAAMSGSATDYEHLLRDNYETPLYTPQLAGSEFELQQLEMILKLSVDDFKAHALTLSSPDELSMYIARRLDAAGVAQSALDHHARHRYCPRRRLLALC